MIEAVQSGTNEIEIWEFLFDDLRERLDQLVVTVDKNIPELTKTKALDLIEDTNQLIQTFHKVKK